MLLCVNSNVMIWSLQKGFLLWLWLLAGWCYWFISTVTGPHKESNNECAGWLKQTLNSSRESTNFVGSVSSILSDKHQVESSFCDAVYCMKARWFHRPLIDIEAHWRIEDKTFPSNCRIPSRNSASVSSSIFSSILYPNAKTHSRMRIILREPAYLFSYRNIYISLSLFPHCARHSTYKEQWATFWTSNMFAWYASANFAVA